MLKATALWRYDPDLDYKVQQGSHLPQCEVFATTNDLRCDERVGDRVRIVTFSNWTSRVLKDVEALSCKSRKHTELMNSVRKPTEFTIGII